LPPAAYDWFDRLGNHSGLRSLFLWINVEFLEKTNVACETSYSQIYLVLDG
jgi:hypothetical protein